MGNVVSAGLGQAPARQAGLRAGLPDSVGGLTVNKVCGSGLKAVALARALITAGDARIVVAGGMENMTRAPYLLPQARAGYRLGNGELVDAVVRGRDPLHDGAWARSTLEVCLAMLTSAREDRDVTLTRQARASPHPAGVAPVA